MNIFAIGLGGAGGEIIGKLLEEVKIAREEGKRLNFDYATIDFPKGIEKLSWEPAHERRISLDKVGEEWIEENFKGFQKENIPLDPETGTGRRRCYSKVTFEYNRTRIEGALKDLLKSFFDEFKTRDVACWIFTSFGGGTGSGMFIDLAVLLGELKTRMKREGLRLTIYLVGILPSADDRGDDILSPPNAIQAFKEIDYVVSDASKEGKEIENPLHQIFIVGLYKMMGPLERAKLMIDKMVAKCIIEFCYGIKDFNDMVSVINDKMAGLQHKRFLSLSLAHYYFPMNEILELYERENTLFEKRKDEAKFQDEIKKLEKEIEEIDKTIRKTNGEINDRTDKIVDAKKGLLGPYDLIRITLWEKQLKRLDDEKKKRENDKRPMERNKGLKDETLKGLQEEIKNLGDKIAELKVWLEGKEEEYFSRESIEETKYEKIKEDIQNLKQMPLKDLVNHLKKVDILDKSFDEILEKRMEYLIRSQPLIITEKKNIPLLELGHKDPVGSIGADVLRQPANVAEMEKRKILRKADYEVDLYAILGGIAPEMINDLRIFIEDYYLTYQDSNPEVIDKSLAGFLWGQKKWSEYNPDWLDVKKKTKK